MIKGDGPVVEIAQGLQALRVSAGLTLEELSFKTYYSIATLSEATDGKTLPSEQVTLNYVIACGGNETEWAARWHEARRASHSEERTPDAAPDQPHIRRPAASSDCGAPEPNQPGWPAYLAGAMVVLMIVLALGFSHVSPTATTILETVGATAWIRRDRIMIFRDRIMMQRNRVTPNNPDR